MNTSQGQNLIQSVCRAIAILRCFNNEQELSLTDISNNLGLHKSTTSGIINTLRVENFLERNESNGKYRLGLDIFRIAANSRVEFNQLCEPYLDTLFNLTGETVNLAVRDGLDIVYLAKKESSHSMRISTKVGMRLPIYCTAIGKAILSVMDKSIATELVNAMDIKAFTSHTVNSKEKLLNILENVRREGLAYDYEELEYGLVCVAAPIYYELGKPLGAISVSGPSIRMNEGRQKHIGDMLHKISKEISRELYRVAMS